MYTDNEIDGIDEGLNEMNEAITNDQAKRKQRLQSKHKDTIDRFLDTGKKVHVVGIVPGYYGYLLAWAIRQYIEKEGWHIFRTVSYRDQEPVYTDIKISHDREEKNILLNGEIMVRKGNYRFIVTVDINPGNRCIVQLEGLSRHKKMIEKFVDGTLTIVREQNFYRGKKIEFSGHIRFLGINPRAWDSIILDSATKDDLRANTIGFLHKTEILAGYGIPQKRGIILAGEPGTGKTIICKGLMSEADGITCITANSYCLRIMGYISELYELAVDLSPCIVFIEDIDIIGQKRDEFGYIGGGALPSLLAVMDGVEEMKQIVTVATTNSLETLDKALSERPSRFDRVIKLQCPSLPERQMLINNLCLKIPLDEKSRDYIARKSDGCSPAQIQEIIFSIAIEKTDKSDVPDFTFNKEAIEEIIGRINRRNETSIGFRQINKNNGYKSDLITTMNKEGNA